MSFGMTDLMTRGDLIAGPSVQSLGNSPFIKEKTDFTSPVLLFHRFFPPLLFLLTTTAPPPPFFNSLFHSQTHPKMVKKKGSATTAGVASSSVVAKATADATKRVAPEVSAAGPRTRPVTGPL
jgi:hypothetical protein